MATIVERFVQEVADRGAEACLPCNLSDEWLLVVTGGLGHLLGVQDGPELPYSPETLKAVGVAALLTIVRAKVAPESQVLEVGLEKLQRYAVEYRVELGLEEVHRRTDVKYEAATMHTILTNRDVKTWKAEGPGRRKGR
jgi:hypothetical protein